MLQIYTVIKPRQSIHMHLLNLRLLAFVTKAIPSTPRRCFSFSTSLGSTPKSANVFEDGAEGGSAVYQHALKFQRPTVIKLQKQLKNTVSLIGSVSRELQVMKSKRRFGVYTSLDVQNPNKSKRSFRLVLLLAIYQHLVTEEELFWMMLVLIGVEVFNGF